jgi:hypothetical protein
MNDRSRIGGENSNSDPTKKAQILSDSDSDAQHLCCNRSLWGYVQKKRLTLLYNVQTTLVITNRSSGDKNPGSGSAFRMRIRVRETAEKRYRYVFDSSLGSFNNNSEKLHSLSTFYHAFV